MGYANVIIVNIRLWCRKPESSSRQHRFARSPDYEDFTGDFLSSLVMVSMWLSTTKYCGVGESDCMMPP